MEGIRIFYDGVQMDKYGVMPFVVGYTTNTTIMRQAGITNYAKFFQEHKDVIGNKPISFQVFEDEHEAAVAQAMDISSIGENVYVKVPVVTTTGKSNAALLSTLLNKEIKVNVTTVFTTKQIDEIYTVIKESVTSHHVPMIVSVFAGRISDTAEDPVPIIKYAVEKMSSFPHVEVLWAGCKETLSIKRAIDCGCHIITIPEPILDRFGRIGKDLHEMSIDTASSFRKDAIQGALTVL